MLRSAVRAPRPLRQARLPLPPVQYRCFHGHKVGQGGLSMRPFLSQKHGADKPGGPGGQWQVSTSVDARGTYIEHVYGWNVSPYKNEETTLKDHRERILADRERRNMDKAHKTASEILRKAKKSQSWDPNTRHAQEKPKSAGEEYADLYEDTYNGILNGSIDQLQKPSVKYAWLSEDAEKHIDYFFMFLRLCCRVAVCTVVLWGFGVDDLQSMSIRALSYCHLGLYEWPEWMVKNNPVRGTMFDLTHRHGMLPAISIVFFGGGGYLCMRLCIRAISAVTPAVVATAFDGVVHTSGACAFVYYILLRLGRIEYPDHHACVDCDGTGLIDSKKEMTWFAYLWLICIQGDSRKPLSVDGQLMGTNPLSMLSGGMIGNVGHSRNRATWVYDWPHKRYCTHCLGSGIEQLLWPSRVYDKVRHGLGIEAEQLSDLEKYRRTKDRKWGDEIEPGLKAGTMYMKL